jgi:DNA primase
MMAAEGGAERFRALLDGAVELTAFQVGLVLDRTDTSSPAERDRTLAEVAPILAGLGESASRDDLVRRVAERLDLEPAMVMGRVVSAQPLSGGTAEAAGQGRAVAAAPQRTAELTSRERRERALLAMCIALPEEGKDYLTRLTDAHLSQQGARAAAWLREHRADPASNLPHDDSELAGLIAELVILAHDEPASPEAMELNYLLLEQRRLEADIAAAGEAEDPKRRAALSMERAALVVRIARTERVGG